VHKDYNRKSIFKRISEKEKLCLNCRMYCTLYSLYQSSHIHLVKQ
jgi:hypothetical protein